MTVRRQLLVLLLGAGTIGVAMLAGRTDLVTLLFEPPTPARLLLGPAAALLAIGIGLRATDRLGDRDGDAPELIRAVRLLFLAVGVGAMAAGWLIGSPVPIVAGLVICGVDVLETTFLLMVTAARGR
jgi:hypothetical protein